MAVALKAQNLGPAGGFCSSWTSCSFCSPWEVQGDSGLPPDPSQPAQEPSYVLLHPLKPKPFDATLTPPRRSKVEGLL